MSISLSTPSATLSKLDGMLGSTRPLLMGILNITPDSFSDGGVLLSPADGETASIQKVVDIAGQMLEAGASILDIGGESTRPSATPLNAQEEQNRVLPVIEALHTAFPETILSIDTRKSSVAAAAIQAGASIINDVSGLQFDLAMASVAAKSKAYLVINHTQGTPQTMQDNPAYPNGVVEEITSFFGQQILHAIAAGVEVDRIILDPGFGFGKTVEHNLTLLKHLKQLTQLPKTSDRAMPHYFPILAGLSRKSFLTLGKPEQIPPTERDILSVAAMLQALVQGVRLFRVHNIKAHQQALELYYSTQYEQPLSLQ